MKTHISYRNILLGLGLLFILGWATHVLWSKATAHAYEFHGTVLTKPRALPEFSLEGTGEAAFDNAHLQGHWTFLFMGFSHCASICPITMAELGKMNRLLAHHATLPSPEVVMVTLDPHRDDLVRMRDYVHSFDAHFIGARGSEEMTKKLARYLGIAYNKLPQKDKKLSGDYNIEHSGAIILLNPKGELAAFFTPPHRAEWLVEDYQHLTREVL